MRVKLGAFVLSVVVALGLTVVAAAELTKNGLPAWTDGYQKWHRINKKPIVDGSPAHFGVKNVYESKRKAGKRWPYGTVIVKEATQPGKKWVYLVAVMRKVRGASPKNNDWVMIEYTRNAPAARFARLASGQICYSCHVGAKTNDYVFTKG